MKWALWGLAAVLLVGCFATGAYAGYVSRQLEQANARVAQLNKRMASLEKDVARVGGTLEVSSDEFADMRKAATEQERQNDIARKIADDAITECWNEGNVAVDGLDTFIGGRVVCIRPYNVKLPSTAVSCCLDSLRTRRTPSASGRWWASKS